MIAFVKADAQDPHFTQVNRLASMVNPAVALSDNNNMQITMLYRTQWNNVAPFKTQGIAFNKKVNVIPITLGAEMILKALSN